MKNYGKKDKEVEPEINVIYEKIDNYLFLKGPDYINFHIYDSKTYNRFLVNLGMIVFMPQNLRYLAI